MPTFQEPTITCPNCHSPIKLTEQFAAPLVESARREYEQKLSQQNAQIAEREKAVLEKQAQLEKEKQSVDQSIAARLAQERTRIAAEESQKARQAFTDDLTKRETELADLKTLFAQRGEKLEEAQKAQARLLEAQRKLEEEKREMDLTIQKRIQESKDAIRAQALKEADDKAALKLVEKNQELRQAEEKLQLAAQREQTLAQQFQAQLEQERKQIAAQESQKAKTLLESDLKEKADQLADLQNVLKQRDSKLAEAQKAQLEFLRKQREFDEKAGAMELTIETRIAEALGKTKDAARQEAEEKIGLRLREKEEVIASMQKKIEELSRKAEQGSQQLQGEALELQLESLLAGKFPLDKIEPVPKGEHGGDLLHHITHPSGSRCGTILWESKRTKAWSNLWLAKLRDDQRAARADIAIIVSTALPESITSFDLVDGVWVTSPRMFLPVALCLRQSLIDIAGVRTASEGQQTKMEMVYQYLTGPNFKRRIEAIAEAFTTMQDDLEKERKVMIKQWAKRQEQLERVMIATSGMYGELQAIAGSKLLQVDALDLKALDTDDKTNPAH